MVADGPGLDRRARGDVAERAARDALVRAGLQEVAANANYRGGELDLVMIDPDAREGRTLVFVEVRYRATNAFGGGAASISRGKRRKLVLAAQLFLSGHREYAGWPCRFDVVDASGDPDAPQIEWIKDAFRPDDP